ncbi:MAG: riboflavin synthase [Candidatus Micrarchaeota archaeon]|nr:riboflavin synthase [Candidatus Micrarchaeota archaeon]
MKIGIVDTTFARINMGKIAIEEIEKINKQKIYPPIVWVRRTVPGIKDLAVECQILFEKENCDIILALGMVGPNPIDEMCANQASNAIQLVKLKHSKHIIEVFVHCTESLKNGKFDEKDFYKLTENRTKKHVYNAVNLIYQPDKLVENAGKGLRQGREDEGEIKIR